MSQEQAPCSIQATSESDAPARALHEVDRLDCAIVGAGPAGLTALEYLARFHRRAVALGARGPRPRSLLIDRSYNLPGHPEGIPGSELLARLRTQAESVNGLVSEETVEHIEGSDGNFSLHLSDGSLLRARKVILAMGVRDRKPDIPGIEHHEGHFVRYCPVCDGYEHTGKHLGILGSGGSVARHALFLQTFSNRITVFLHGESSQSLGHYQQKLSLKGIDVYEPRVVKIMQNGWAQNSQTQSGHAQSGHAQSGETPGDSESEYNGCGVCLEDGSTHPLSVLYSALGCDLPLAPVRHLGLDLDEDGYVRVDSNQETSVPGIYAAGDLVSQINQISVAFGQATIAAVRIHNVLHDED